MYPSIDNECDIDNGDCEQICVDNFSSYTCACEDGYALDLDGYTCRGIEDYSPVLWCAAATQ